jgi:hypothetical protein
MGQGTTGKWNYGRIVEMFLAGRRQEPMLVYFTSPYPNASMLPQLPLQDLAKRLVARSSIFTYATSFLFSNPERSYFLMWYSYLRWVDDYVDEISASPQASCHFIDDQCILIELLYEGICPRRLTKGEEFLPLLVNYDRERECRLRLLLGAHRLLLLDWLNVSFRVLSYFRPGSQQLTGYWIVEQRLAGPAWESVASRVDVPAPDILSAAAIG